MDPLQDVQNLHGGAVVGPEAEAQLRREQAARQGGPDRAGELDAAQLQKPAVAAQQLHPVGHADAGRLQLRVLSGPGPVQVAEVAGVVEVAQVFQRLEAALILCFVEAAEGRAEGRAEAG